MLRSSKRVSSSLVLVASRSRAMSCSLFMVLCDLVGGWVRIRNYRHNRSLWCHLQRVWWVHRPIVVPLVGTHLHSLSMQSRWIRRSWFLRVVCLFGERLYRGQYTSCKTHTRTKLSSEKLCTVPQSDEPLKVFLEYTLSSDTVFWQNCIQTWFGGVWLITPIIQFDRIIGDFCNQIVVKIDRGDTLNGLNASVCSSPVCTLWNCVVHLGFDLTHGWSPFGWCSYNTRFWGQWRNRVTLVWLSQTVQVVCEFLIILFFGLKGPPMDDTRKRLLKTCRRDHLAVLTIVTHLNELVDVGVVWFHENNSVIFDWTE